MASLELDKLPLLVVSTRDQNSAEVILSEIIDKDIPEDNGDINNKSCIWRLVNKYYTANVRLYPLLDGQKLESHLVDSVEAHLIYLTEDESSANNAADVMRRRARAVPASAAHVRVVAADAAEAPALVAACAAERVELVPLREPPDPLGDDDRRDWDEIGIARVRAAFHAHVWPGLVRQGCEDTTQPNGEVTPESSDDEWSEWCTGPRAADADAAFAAALASLPGAAGAVRAGAAGGAISREQRLAQAEELVAAFCRALGTPLD